MGHTNLILRIVSDFESRKALTALYERPLPIVSPFTIPTGLLTQFFGDSPDYSGAKERFKKSSENNPAFFPLAGIALCFNELLGFPAIIPTERCARRAFLDFHINYALDITAAIQKEMANVANCSTSLLEHSHKTQNRDSIHQLILFSPYTDVKYWDDNKDLPYEEGSPSKHIRMLSYLVCRGILNPDNERHAELIRGAFGAHIRAQGLAAPNIDQIMQNLRSDDSFLDLDALLQYSEDFDMEAYFSKKIRLENELKP